MITINAAFAPARCGRVALCLLTILAGLTGPLAAQQPVAAAASTSDGVVASSYVLGPNDQLLIEVFQEDDLRTNTLISKDGSINFPLIGTVKLAGLTQGQARDRIAELLEHRYLVSPRVSVSVIRFARKRFTVLGQVGRPGSYDLPDQESIDILEAVAMAGGYTKISKSSAITVKRKIDGVDKAFTIDARRMATKADSERFIVLPGDTITVPETMF